ncbi:MAG: hypothetical protein LBE06_03160 [Azoarcus sp.]|jgi:MSHA biogenesis protein MshP|nr:hypothetical protein [Azoarcus sp.]
MSAARVGLEMRRAQRGMGAVMAIAVLVILALLAGALVRFGSAQQLGAAQDVLLARAGAALRAGSEWGRYRALQQEGACGSGMQLDLRAETGFLAVVDCGVRAFGEGEDAGGNPVIVRVFTITTLVCNSAGACPDDAMASSPAYIERQHVTVVTDE